MTRDVWRFRLTKARNMLFMNERPLSSYRNNESKPSSCVAEREMRLSRNVAETSSGNVHYTFLK